MLRAKDTGWSITAYGCVHDRSASLSFQPAVLKLPLAQGEKMKRTLKRIVLCAFAALSLASCTMFKQAPQHDVHIPSTLDTVVWGHIPTGRAPVARVRPGQIVRIDTI